MDVHYNKVKESPFSGKIWSQKKGYRPGYEDRYPDITFLQSYGKTGLSTNPGEIHQGANSGYQAINLALLLGAEIIYLLGYDMKGCGVHFFGKHPPELNQVADYSTFIPRYDTIRPENYNISIINCSRDTALSFPRADISDILEIYSNEKSNRFRDRSKPGEAER